jgi:hypothetical protein
VGGGLNGIGVPLVRKNRVIVHTTMGMPINSNNMPSGNLTGNEMDRFNFHVLSSHGASMTII